MGRERTKRDSRPERGSRAAGGRATLALALLLPLLSGCVAGLLVRGVTWSDETIPIWVVLWEERGECTVVIDDVLIRHQRHTVNTDTNGNLLLGCGNGFIEGKDQKTSADISISGPLQEIASSPPGTARRGPILVDSDLTIGHGWPLYAFTRLYGLRLGQSTFCIPEVDYESLRFVYSAGVNKDVHVLVAAGSRECDIPVS